MEEDGSISAAPRGRPITTLPVLLWRELKEFCLKEKEIYSMHGKRENKSFPKGSGFGFKSKTSNGAYFIRIAIFSRRKRDMAYDGK